MGARLYSPSAGVFTSMDTYAGSAADPLSLNRFLYAEASPATLVDPTGHAAVQGCASSDLCDETMAIRHGGTAAGREALKSMARRDASARHYAAKHAADKAAGGSSPRGCAATGDCAAASSAMTMAGIQAWWRSATPDERNQLYAQMYGRELSYLRTLEDEAPQYLACTGTGGETADACSFDRFTTLLEESAAPALMAAGLSAWGAARAAATSGVRPMQTGAIVNEVRVGDGQAVAPPEVPFGPVPANATDTLQVVRQTGQAPAGFVGGDPYHNRGPGYLPPMTADGAPISYQEWDVNPFTSRDARGLERIVTGSDGAAYYTSNHYTSFVQFWSLGR